MSKRTPGRAEGLKVKLPPTVCADHLLHSRRGHDQVIKQLRSEGRKQMGTNGLQTPHLLLKSASKHIGFRERTFPKVI